MQISDDSDELDSLFLTGFQLRAAINTAHPGVRRDERE